MAKGQKQRTSKTSLGKHGAGGKGRPLTNTEKILLGGGMLNGVSKRWKEQK